MNTAEQWLTEYGLSDEQHQYQEWLYKGLTSGNEYLSKHCRKELIVTGDQYIENNKEYLDKE